MTACPYCGGHGYEGEVSWEMATDAGEPELQGQMIPCRNGCRPPEKEVVASGF